MAATRLVAPLVAAALTAGCQADRPFKTSAVYQTGDGRCIMSLETRGVVRAGNDLARDAEGRLTLSSSSQEPGAPPPGVCDRPQRPKATGWGSSTWTCGGFPSPG